MLLLREVLYTFSNARIPRMTLFSVLLTLTGPQNWTLPTLMFSSTEARLTS